MNNNQFAYRTGGSCTNALLKIQHEFLQALDSNDNRAVRLFTMDVSKAVDRVKHNLLIEKLTQSPLNPYIANWYVSFLSDRKQSEWSVIILFVIGRMSTVVLLSEAYLFNLFLNDLDVAQYSQDSDLTKYADDTSILETVRKNSVDESQKALNAFLEWTEVNGMSCNTSKCKELCMAKTGVSPNFPPLCGIEPSDSFTLLGVTLQKRL